MDLTLECVRRYYRHEDSPLAPALGRYADFFALFEDFQGYVDFFLLQDLVSADYEAVRFFMPFNDFSPPAIPRDLDTYLELRRLSIEFTGFAGRCSYRARSALRWLIPHSPVQRPQGFSRQG
jgi:hypothetical protein